jgi:HEAT repeat protein
VLVDPVTGWLVGLLGDAWTSLLRGSPDERVVRTSMADAVESVIEQARPEAREPLRQGLALVFSRPPTAHSGAGLRAAVVAQVNLLRQMVDESGRPFFESVPVEPDRLASDLGEAFVAALERAVTATGPAEQVHALRAERLSIEVQSIPDQVAERLSGSLEEVRELLRGLGEPTVDDAAFVEARQRYLQRLVDRHRRVDLEILTPLTEQGEHPAMLLGQVFIPQTVRENPPPVELPREVWRRLVEEGHLDLSELPPEVDRRRVEEARRTYRQRPKRPVLEAVADPAQRTTVVLGDPGAGKSTLARYLMLALATEAPSDQIGWEIPGELAGRLPLLVELRTFADERWRGKTFLDLIDELERSEGLGLPKRLLGEYLRTDGRALVIFDGLDEIFDPRIRAEVTRQIEGFAARYRKARVLVTSRVVGYSRGLLDAAGFTHYMLQDLDDEQINNFATAWYAHSCVDDTAQAMRLRDRLLSAIGNSSAVAELAGNPMLLTILAIIGRRRELPRDRRTVYQHAVMVLIEHWDVNKFLCDEGTDPPLLDHEDKLRLLHLVARRMQDGPAGLAGNHLPAAALLEEFRSYLDEQFSLPKDRAVPIARAMLRQFRERNFILSSFGAGVYGFVHRAFLEFLAADDIYQRFNEREIDEDGLLVIFDLHWSDPAWSEVLLLLIGMLSDRFATEAILRLLNIDPYWQVRDQSPRHLILAFRAIGDARRTSALTLHARAITRHLIALLVAARRAEMKDYENSLIHWIEPVLRQLLSSAQPRWLDPDTYRSWYERSASVDPVIETILRTVRFAAHFFLALRPQTPQEYLQALNHSNPSVRQAAVEVMVDRWPQHPGTLESLMDRAANDPEENVRWVAVEAIAGSWSQDPGILSWLRERATSESMARVRSAAVRAIGDGWSQDPGILSWLRERATSDPDQGVRYAAVRAIVNNSPRNPEILTWLMDLAVGERSWELRLTAVTVIARGWPQNRAILHWLKGRASDDRYGTVRRAAVVAIADGWSQDSETLPWLKDRATSDPDDTVRWAAVVTIADGWSQDSETLPWLKDRATSDPDDTVRSGAVQVIARGWAQDPETLPWLKERATDDPHWFVRGTALGEVVVGWPQDSETLSWLKGRATKDPEEMVRRVAVEEIAGGWSQEPGTWLWLKDLTIDSPHPTVRGAAVRAIADGWPQDPETLPWLKEDAAKDLYGHVRLTAVEAVIRGWPQDPETLPWLKGRVAHDSEVNIRLTAVEAVAGGWPHDPETLPWLKERAIRDWDEDVRKVAQQAIQELGPEWPSN